jgi:hypothetical protein
MAGDMNSHLIMPDIRIIISAMQRELEIKKTAHKALRVIRWVGLNTSKLAAASRQGVQNTQLKNSLVKYQ